MPLARPACAAMPVRLAQTVIAFPYKYKCMCESGNAAEAVRASSVTRERSDRPRRAWEASRLIRRPRGSHGEADPATASPSPFVRSPPAQTALRSGARPCRRSMQSGFTASAPSSLWIWAVFAAVSARGAAAASRGAGAPGEVLPCPSPAFREATASNPTRGPARPSRARLHPA